MKTIQNLSSKSEVIRFLPSSCLWICLLIYLQSCGGNRPSAFFVAPDGRDTDSTSAPFASLEAARNAIRKLKDSAPLPKGGITVYLKGGSYPISQTFELNQQDSGTAESPIVYRNYQREKVSLTGGVSLKASDFQKVQDPLVLQKLPEEARHQVLRANLRDLGIVNYGKLYQHGFSLPIQEAPLELFVDGQPMTLARWPNDGTVKIGAIIDRGSNPREGDMSNRGGRFRFDFDRATRWTQANDIWLNGIFSYGYADDNLKVAQIDLKKKEITLSQPHIYSLMGSDEETGGKHLRGFYVYNLLEEIDRPGEYFVDRDKGILYFWPTSEMPGRELVVSVFEKPLVAMENASHVVIEGLTFENARGMAVYLEEGEGNRLRGCTFRNLGTVAVCLGKGVDGPQGPVHEFSGSPAARKIGNVSAQGYQNNAWNRMAGKNHVIENCLIYNTGTGGIILDGGDRKSLAPGNNAVLGSHFHHFNRWNKTYCPAVALKGVGNRVANNYIHDAPHQAISLNGNDHLIEYNRIERVCLAADDMGAIYNGRNPSERGNMIRYNFFLNFQSDESRIAAVYFDDGAGGGRVFGNVFYRVGHPRFGTIFVHGGHDHIFENNIFVECKRVFGNSPWPDQRWNDYVAEDLWQKRLTQEVDISHPPYITKYPELKGFLESVPRPRINRGLRNVVYRCDTFGVPEYELKDNFVTEEDPGFVDPGKLNFQLRDNSAVYQRIPGFERIPFEKIKLPLN